MTLSFEFLALSDLSPKRRWKEYGVYNYDVSFEFLVLSIFLNFLLL